MKTFREYLENYSTNGNGFEKTATWTPSPSTNNGFGSTNNGNGLSSQDNEEFQKIATAWRKPGDWRVSVEEKLKEFRNALATHKEAIKRIQAKLGQLNATN